MKRNLLILITVSIILGLFGCGVKNASNVLEITDSDREMIVEYLETKTDDIMPSHDGKTMVSVMEFLGTDKNKVYIWAYKSEYVKFQGEVKQVGDSVSLPVVLNVRKENGELKIVNHKYPLDGERYRTDVKKLFPPNMIELFYFVDRDKLPDVAKIRAEEKLALE